MAPTAEESSRIAANRQAMAEYNEKVIAEFRANGGKVGGMMEGMPVILITCTGAKSGRQITRPLVYSRDGNRCVIVASYAGGPHNPPWYHNLIKNPLCTVEIGTEKFRARATPTTGAGRGRWGRAGVPPR